MRSRAFLLGRLDTLSPTLAVTAHPGLQMSCRLPAVLACFEDLPQ